MLQIVPLAYYSLTYYYAAYWSPCVEWVRTFLHIYSG
jgi:hypothetical protein